MVARELEVKLTLEGPFITHGQAPGGWGLDAVLRRDEEGRVLVPGTLIKGRLRAALDELIAADPEWFESEAGEDGGAWIDAWFGEESHAAEAFQSPASWERVGRGRLQFSEFTSTTPGRRQQARYRIEIEERLGAVKKGSLLALESPFDTNEEIEFEGAIRFLEPDDTVAASVRERILAGLRWIPQIGAERTVGFGRLKDGAASLKNSKVRSQRLPSSEAIPEQVQWLVKPLDPFGFAVPQTIRNLHVSADTIPGGGLKAALAATWREHLGLPPGMPVSDSRFVDEKRPTLKQYFDDLVVRHAVPESEIASGVRPLVPPLSLAQVKHLGASEGPKRLVDLACRLSEEPVYQTDDSFSLSFAIDLKESDRQEIRALFPQAQIRRDLRVRTRIDAELGKAADEELFARELIVPGKRAWVSELGLGRIPPEKRESVLEELTDLLSGGLFYLGKSKAVAKVEIGTSPAQRSRPGSLEPVVSADQRAWIVTLQTPGLLFSHRGMDAGAGAQALREKYRAYWDEVSEGTVRMKGFLATQYLSGGVYLHGRFRRGKGYNPFVLTEPGSVFYLEEQDPQAANNLRLWATQGLPLSETVKSDYDLSEPLWRACPYLPENGYGELAVNLDVHTTHALTVDETAKSEVSHE